MKEVIERVAELVAEQLPPELHRHTLGTREWALELARGCGCEPAELARVELAALLHDNCKHWEAARLLAEAESLGYVPAEVERAAPALLHARVGAHRLARAFGVTDASVFAAVYYHTVGGPGLDRVARIIYCADKLEPGREYPGVEELRARASGGLRELCLAVIASGLPHLMARRTLIHPETLTFYNELVMEALRGG